MGKYYYIFGIIWQKGKEKSEGEIVRKINEVISTKSTNLLTISWMQIYSIESKYVVCISYNYFMDMIYEKTNEISKIKLAMNAYKLKKYTTEFF